MTSSTQSSWATGSRPNHIWTSRDLVGPTVSDVGGPRRSSDRTNCADETDSDWNRQQRISHKTNELNHKYSENDCISYRKFNIVLRHSISQNMTPLITHTKYIVRFCRILFSTLIWERFRRPTRWECRRCMSRALGKSHCQGIPREALQAKLSADNWIVAYIAFRRQIKTLLFRASFNDDRTWLRQL